MNRNEKYSWEEQIHNGFEISCAAFAIAAKIVSSKRPLSSICKNAMGIQKQLGWGKKVFKHQFQKFVDVYTNYRITIIMTTMLDQRNNTFTGKDFKYEKPTGPGNEGRLSTETHPYVIYLVWDGGEHYGLTVSPLKVLKTTPKNSFIHWCHECTTGFKSNSPCNCSEPKVSKKQKPQKKKLCKWCGMAACVPGQCWKACKTCGQDFKFGYDHRKGEGHRCLVYKEKRDEEFIPSPGDGYMLWAYDFEACLTRVPGTLKRFKYSNSSAFEIENGTLKVVEIQCNKHEVNLAVCQNVFNENEVYTFYGDMALGSFIDKMLTINEGKNICIAHNASGYDARLIMDYLTEHYEKTKVNQLMTGTKILELKVGNTIFRDSLKHLPGSLNSLAKAYGLNISKGFFPHLFNSTENYDYEGIIPPLEYFELPFTMTSQKDIDDFKQWHSTETSEKTIWNFKNELTKYCINDVKILAELILRHHEINVEMFKLSPWFSSTAPGYGLKVQKALISTDEFLQLPDDEGDDISKARRNERMIQLARKEHWAALEPVEYWGARGALRGGRTDVKKVYHKLSDEEIIRGCRIAYVDVVSMYPAVQLEENYPLGVPTIYIYDKDYYPCLRHCAPTDGSNFVDLKCSCAYSGRKKQRLTSLDVVDVSNEQLTKTQILQLPDFHGWAQVTLFAPLDMFHPVLPVFTDKCTFPVGVMNGRWPCCEIKYALECGYELIKIHRYDKYNFGPGLWNDIIKKLYVEKMASSEPLPSVENQQRLINAYEEKFGMGEMVRESFPRWEFNPPKRQTYKIALNSGWGKHCQRPNLGSFEIIPDSFTEGHNNMWINIENNLVEITGIHAFKNSTAYKMKNRVRKNNFHDAYLPAGLHVPAYGRIKLHRQLNKLQKRVLYYDTDSIIYIYDPQEYNVSSSDILGDWDEEKISKKGIAEFVGLGPKSYGLRTFSGDEVIKVKGLSLKFAHKEMFNFDTLKNLIDAHLQNMYPRILLPQQTFTYKMGQGIRVEHILKKFSFQPEILKGDLKEDLFIYPFNYASSLISVD